MALNRLRVKWGGTGIVGPGLSTFYFSGTMTGKPAAVLTLFDSVKASIPAGLTWEIPSSGDVLDESTGELTGGWTASGGGNVTATGTGNFAQGVGPRFVWATNGIFLGRRVHGSTFMCPLITSQYDASGTIQNAMITAWNGFATTFVTAVSPDFKIWSRPRPGGQYATNQVTGGTVPDAVSWLRSRRT